jgi:hypothetical protein
VKVSAQPRRPAPAGSSKNALQPWRPARAARQRSGATSPRAGAGPKVAEREGMVRFERVFQLLCEQASAHGLPIG